MIHKTDVAIIGCGPAGSTCGAFLRKYDPSIRVSIYERSRFPRDHVGESLLPMVCTILQELGVWDQMEAANFPIKVGATFQWGNSDELWDFNFLPKGEFHPVLRPSAYEGQRVRTAFQVDRAQYDLILAKFAEDLGCSLNYQLGVTDITRQGDRIESLTLQNGDSVQASYYIDASGHSGILRRKLKVNVDEPSQLQNVAIWDYWKDAKWAVELGTGGTRIQILSVQYGWLWYIQIGDDRTSVGLVCPVEYFKKCGLTTEELYKKAIGDKPLIANLLKDAERQNQLSTTKDWSFLSERMCGENWYLVGESQGFADPILSAGLTLTHVAAREAAFSILEERRGSNKDWIKKEYEERNMRRISQHIRFADYWYAGNKHFTELKDSVSAIASDFGLELSGESAFRWLASGGFVEEDMEVAGLAAVRLDQLHAISSKLSVEPPKSRLEGNNVFDLNLEFAESVQLATYREGRVLPIPGLKRGKKILPLNRYFAWVIDALKFSPQLDQALGYLNRVLSARGTTFDSVFQDRILEALEAMIRDDWVRAYYSPKFPVIHHYFQHTTGMVRPNLEGK